MTARGAVVQEPSRFYTVSALFSDNGPAFYYRILDVKQDCSDAIVRYVRVAPSSVYCPRLVVQAMETRIRNTSPAKLAGRINPCAVKPDALRASLKRFGRSAGVFEAISFGIIAECGPAPSVALGLPIDQLVDLEKVRKARPEMARLWDLTSEVTARVFGEKDIFQDKRDEEDAALQRAGEALVPEIISGYYDPGLRLAVSGNVGTWRSPSFQSLLSGYKGPISATEAKAALVPQLRNAGMYRFERFILVTYPPLALQARIQGPVELELKIEPSTGLVDTVTAVSGHPLLTPGAITAAKQWRFVPNSVSSERLHITLDYELDLQCR